MQKYLHKSVPFTIFGGGRGYVPKLKANVAQAEHTIPHNSEISHGQVKEYETNVSNQTRSQMAIVKKNAVPGSLHTPPVHKHIGVGTQIKKISHEQHGYFLKHYMLLCVSQILRRLQKKMTLSSLAEAEWPSG